MTRYWMLLCQLMQSTPMFWRKNWIFWWSISLYAFSNSFCDPTKLEPLSLRNTLIFPLRATNRRRASMKESVPRSQVRSIWTILLEKHVNITPFLISSSLPSFIIKGPNMSTPQFVYGSSSILLSVSRSAIFCSPSFPRNNRHLIHFPTKLLTIVLHWTPKIQCS